MSKADPHWVRDSLIEDAVHESELRTGERKGREAEQFVVPILERMEQKQKSSARNVRGSAQKQFQDEAKRQGIDGHVERFVPEKIVTPQTAENEFTAKLRKRLQWIHGQPEFESERKAICSLFMLGYRKAAHRRAVELIKKTDEKLKKPWQKSDPKRLIFG